MQGEVGSQCLPGIDNPYICRLLLEGAERHGLGLFAV